MIDSPIVDMKVMQKYIDQTFQSYWDGLITKTEALDKLHTLTFHNICNNARVLEEKLFTFIKYDINKL